MNNRLVEIKNGLVVNSFMYDGAVIPDHLRGMIATYDTTHIGDLYDGVSFKRPAPSPASTDPRDYPLTPYQFKRFMRGKAGYHLAVNAVLAYFEWNDEDAWALYSAEIENSTQYNFETMINFIGSAKVKPLIPKTIDVSETSMAKLWMIAKDY
ncbi:MAG: hypothetical protein COA84_13190 [Robiginitomaculum sp.]|nr:MAG: hypothetical protein COA84_13190 [Robiginitomaculum sp.]